MRSRLTPQMVLKRGEAGDRPTAHAEGGNPVRDRLAFANDGS